MISDDYASSLILKLTLSHLEICQNFVFVGQLVGLATEPSLFLFPSFSLSLSLSRSLARSLPPPSLPYATPSSLLFSVLCDNKELYRFKVCIFILETLQVIPKCNVVYSCICELFAFSHPTTMRFT